METLRKPYQGVWNIIRFNWHFYILSIGVIPLLTLFSILNVLVHPYVSFSIALGVLLPTVSSLLVSFYVYDNSNLYALPWMDQRCSTTPDTIVNVNAGFDETSAILEEKYPSANLIALDFYDPCKHTEVSIKRARKAYPPYHNTRTIQTDKIELNTDTADIICAILSAHEIRNQSERELFFLELKRILKPNGQILITEHLRDFPNFMAYTIGFFHFHSKNTWLKTFESAGLRVSSEIKTTAFISTFILEHATTS